MPRICQKCGQYTVKYHVCEPVPKVEPSPVKMKRTVTYREHVTIDMERTQEAREKAYASIPLEEGWDIHFQGPIIKGKNKGGYRIRASREITGSIEIKFCKCSICEGTMILKDGEFQKGNDSSNPCSCFDE